LVTPSASAVESPSRERPGWIAKPWDISWELMYRSVDVEDIDEDDADEVSENGDRRGDGAQWTVFFVAGVGVGVAAMRVIFQREIETAPLDPSNHVVASATATVHDLIQLATTIWDQAWGVHSF